MRRTRREIARSPLPGATISLHTALGTPPAGCRGSRRRGARSRGRSNPKWLRLTPAGNRLPTWCRPDCAPGRRPRRARCTPPARRSPVSAHCALDRADGLVALRAVLPSAAGLTGLSELRDGCMGDVRWDKAEERSTPASSRRGSSHRGRRPPRSPRRRPARGRARTGAAHCVSKQSRKASPSACVRRRRRTSVPRAAVGCACSTHDTRVSACYAQSAVRNASAWSKQAGHARCHGSTTTAPAAGQNSAVCGCRSALQRLLDKLGVASPIYYLSGKRQGRRNLPRARDHCDSRRCTPRAAAAPPGRRRRILPWRLIPQAAATANAASSTWAAVHCGCSCCADAGATSAMASRAGAQRVRRQRMLAVAVRSSWCGVRAGWLDPDAFVGSVYMY